uniref:BACK domain-containing protein n=1 Tax=Glossina brevipalpis TaxID=37001 RepID=A0A1A9WIM1_9MUSC
MPDEQLVKIVKSDLKPSLGSLVFAVKAVGMSELRSECKRAEKFLYINCFVISAGRNISGVFQLDTLSCVWHSTSDGQAFLTSSFEEAIIADDNLYMQFEENVYETVLNWVKHDLEARRTHLFLIITV